MWYPGKGLTLGDSFVYVVCDNMQKFAEYDDDNNDDYVAVTLLSGKRYATWATVIFDDGSIVECSVR